MRTHTPRSTSARLSAPLLAVMLVYAFAFGAPAAQTAQAASLSSTVPGSTCSVPSGGTYNYASIQAAVDDANCATIQIAPGTYHVSVTIGRAVTVKGAGASTTILDGTNYPPIFIINQPVAVTFDGLTIRNAYNTYRESSGIFVHAPANVTVTNSTLSNNSGGHSDFGGAISFVWSSGTLTVSNSTFLGNSGLNGGAIYSGATTNTVINSTFSDNHAASGGAISTGNPITIINSTFSGNSIPGNPSMGREGGAISMWGGGTIINSTFYNNQAKESTGGAISARGNINVSSSTFFGNSAIAGGALYAATFGTVKSTIFANNMGQNCDGGAPSDGGNNLSWGDTSCPGLYADPKLGALADNGGATQTMALQADSAAIDRGSCTDLSGAVITTDQRGSARPQGWTCDIGAFESNFKELHAGLIAHWKFDEGSGTITNDSSGTHSGSLVNGASFTNAALPTLKFADPFALNLLGTSHQYVDAGTGLNQANTSFTIAGWAKRSITSGKQWIVSQGTKNTDKALVLGFRDNDHFTCAFYNDDLDTPAAYTDTNVWHHWACTFDAATRSRQVYRDGVLVASDTSKGMFQASGAFNFGRAAWNEAYFSGALDDMRVYNRALSASEVQWLAAGNP